VTSLTIEISRQEFGESGFAIRCIDALSLGWIAQIRADILVIYRSQTARLNPAAVAPRLTASRRATPSIPQYSTRDPVVQLYIIARRRTAVDASIYGRFSSDRLRFSPSRPSLAKRPRL